MYYIATDSTTKVGFYNGEFGEWTAGADVITPLFETWDDAFKAIRDLPNWKTEGWFIERWDD